MVIKAKLTCDTPEWYTPEAIVEASRTLMGGIDLDPSSCEKAQTVVKAAVYFDKEKDGLSQTWKLDPVMFPQTRVLLNPPGGRIPFTSRSAPVLWFHKLQEEYYAGNVDEAVFVGYTVDQLSKTPDFFRYPICFTNACATDDCITGSGRIKFLDHKLVPSKSPSHSNFVVYLPPKDETKAIVKIPLFYKLFSDFGVVGKMELYAP